MTKNYGYMLAKRDETRHEGSDMIKNSEAMYMQYPYWAERKMQMFVPVMATLDEEQFGL